MWLDNASDIDVLFYEPYADVISEIALNKECKPLTIGIFGVWGAGKSTLLKLIENKVLGENAHNSETRTICININAWMFEGYEDAKVAMMESLLQELDNKAPEPLKKKFKALLKKTDRFKLSMKALGFSAPLLAALVKGNVLPIIQGIIQGLSSLSEKQIADGVEEGSKAAMEVKDSCMTEEQDDTNLVHNVRTFRNEFEEALRSVYKELHADHETGAADNK